MLLLQELGSPCGLCRFYCIVCYYCRSSDHPVGSVGFTVLCVIIAGAQITLSAPVGFTVLCLIIVGAPITLSAPAGFTVLCVIIAGARITLWALQVLLYCVLLLQELRSACGLCRFYCIVCYYCRSSDHPVGSCRFYCIVSYYCRSSDHPVGSCRFYCIVCYYCRSSDHPVGSVGFTVLCVIVAGARISLSAPVGFTVLCIIIVGARITLSALQQQLGRPDEALQVLQQEMQTDEQEGPTIVTNSSYSFLFFFHFSHLNSFLGRWEEGHWHPCFWLEACNANCAIKLVVISVSGL